jgi:hypothetical protein
MAGVPVETVAREIAWLAKPLAFGAKLLEIVAIAGATIGILVGIGLAGEREKVTTASLETTTRHPWVGIGIVIVLAAIVLGVFFWCIARALRIFAIESAARQDESIVVEPLPTWPDGDASPLATGHGRRVLAASVVCGMAFLFFAFWSAR